jgi:hypothetical protein
MAAKSLFDHINAITKDKKKDYWNTLDDGDKKSFSNFMILRFLSMNPQWIEFISDVQPLVQELPRKHMYRVMADVIPQGKYFLKYMKAESRFKSEKKDENIEDWIIGLVAKHYEVSCYQAEEYVEIFLKTIEGQQELKTIAEIYGTDPKIIKKLKLKV